MTNEEAKTFLDNLKVCIEEHPIVADWLVEIADRKSEPQTDGYMTAEQAEDYRKMLDKAEHKVYGNIEDEPQSEKCPFDDAIPCEWVCPNSKTDCSWK